MPYILVPCDWDKHYNAKIIDDIHEGFELVKSTPSFFCDKIWIWETKSLRNKKAPKSLATLYLEGGIIPEQNFIMWNLFGVVAYGDSIIELAQPIKDYSIENCADIINQRALNLNKFRGLVHNEWR